jgi:hypothetical protein
MQNYQVVLKTSLQPLSSSLIGKYEKKEIKIYCICYISSLSNSFPLRRGVRRTVNRSADLFFKEYLKSNNFSYFCKERVLIWIEKIYSSYVVFSGRVFL